MPEYTFENTLTKDIITLDMSMKEREEYLANNPTHQQILIKAPALLDPMMMGKLSPSGKLFQSTVLDRMKKSIPGNNIAAQQKRFGAGNVSEI